MNSEALTTQHYITLHLWHTPFMHTLCRLRVQVKTLTAMTSSKGCLYTRTGDWYFCTMMGNTVTPTTWRKKSTKKKKERQSQALVKEREAEMQSCMPFTPGIITIITMCLVLKLQCNTAASGPTQGVIT